MSKLHLIGIDSRGLEPAAREAISHCGCVFCTERFKGLLGDFQGEILPVSPLAEALGLMATRLALGDITVLASGDPLFFGIGRTLIQRFGAGNIIVHPALSSMQLAFARCQEPWEDAAFLSLHGRGDQEILPTLLRRGKVFLLTDSRHRPESVVSALAAGLDDLGFSESDCRVMVAENLGMANERITHGSPAQIAKQSFGELNVMIFRLAAADVDAVRWPFDGVYPRMGAQGTLLGTGGVATHSRPHSPFRSLSPHPGINSVEGHSHPPGPLGLTESQIKHSRGLITKDEVRAVILHQLRLPERGVFWDIGAGSGSVSVEAARLCPELAVYAIERHIDEQANILANRKRSRLGNLHVIAGLAPDAMRDLPDPDRVFIGGSGGQLPAIVAMVGNRLKTDGIIMASAVTEATRQAAPRLFHQHGFAVAITTIAVSRETYPPQLDGPLSLNPITLITGSK